MRATTINKPLRKKIALAISAEVGTVFNVSAPSIEEHEDRDEYHTSGWPFDRFVVPCATGEISISIVVDHFGVDLFCRLRPNGAVGENLSKEEKALAFLVGGNDFSGKVNKHWIIETKATDDDIAEIVGFARSHLLTLRDGKFDPANMITYRSRWR